MATNDQKSTVANERLEMSGPSSAKEPTGAYTKMTTPTLDLPKGGGAIQSIDEKFSVNAVNGTAGLNIPFPFSTSRNGFMPQMGLSYNSGTGNGPYGLGWSAGILSITRKTDTRLPDYTEEDTFVLSGSEDLVPVYRKDASGAWVPEKTISATTTVIRYRPRVEGGWMRIERIIESSGNEYWKITTKENYVSILGKSTTARIADPADPTRIFSWLSEFSYDDKGNCWQAGYKQEDLTGVGTQSSEHHRMRGLAGFANAYLKTVQYGNKIHLDRATIRWDDWDNFLSSVDYLFALVMDYGEHDSVNPQPGDTGPWGCRQDAFSTYRAGFDVRTYRLCRRVLLFHQLPELGDTPCLVRSLDLTYQEGAGFTFLQKATQTGYIRTAPGVYSTRSLPPMEFTYQPLGWDTSVKTLPAESMENLPTGIDDNSYHWVDYFNEGISGILTEQGGSWYFKRNHGNGQFGALELVAEKPSLTGLTLSAVHFQDIEGRGEQFLVSRDHSGYYELNDAQEWEPFQPFPAMPGIALDDPNVRLIDLNGDGRADILVTEDETLLWHASLGKEGYAPYQTVRKPLDEDLGPALVFNDPNQGFILADMTGDGLLDIVRVRYCEVVYWPNLGYGRFGAKVVMDNTPIFDTLENFHSRFVKLADLDGSGTTDIIYLGQDSCKVYYNQNGNSWSEENLVGGANPPAPYRGFNGYGSVYVLDLLGNGTGCIVWSSPLPEYQQHPLSYIDLSGGKKPHLMTGYVNNMGKEVSFDYLPSTYYYLQDKNDGTPWVTKLPFPVQCLSQVVTMDKVAKTRYTQQYSYHHGYYDHAEREFRGFGRVDQTDTEDFENFRRQAAPGGAVQIVDEGFHQPPVLTKSWYHTGAFLNQEQILDQFAQEYYKNTEVPEKTLSDVMPEGMTTEEWREALRACKGQLLRTEVYTPDGSQQAGIPYTTGNHSVLVQMLQPMLENEHAVFLALQSEVLSYTYERNPSDPRIAHNLYLETDSYGNVLQSATVSYGRKQRDSDLSEAEATEQSRTRILFSEAGFTNAIDTPTDYRLPLGSETKTWELTGLSPAGDGYFHAADIRPAFDSAAEIPYEDQPAADKLQKRMLTRGIQLFIKNDLSGPLATGVIESLALPYQSYKLALTPGLRDLLFGGKVTDELLRSEGHYFDTGDGNYWISSGTQVYDAAHFYELTSVTDPFGSTTQMTYDDAYHFYIQQVTDAVGNVAKVTGFNFRTLTPYLLRDLNDNLSGVRMDELGRVTASFVMGKTGEAVGDRMDTTTVERSAGDQPGTVLEYNLDIYRTTGNPNFSKTTVSEIHAADLAAGAVSPVQVSYTYVSGTGEVLMEKRQAEPGMALQLNADGTTTPVDTTPNLRWIGNGRTVLNNKGKPVKQYEPYYSVTSAFEDGKALVELGVTPIMTYDSAGRVVRTDLPDGTLMRVEFDTWKQLTFDQNDTVLESRWYADRITAAVAGIATPDEVAAAAKTAAHAGTPQTAYFDSLGNTFLTVADNGVLGKYRTTMRLDLLGNVKAIEDARGNTVIQYGYEMLGSRMYTKSAEAGERWTVMDVMGRQLRRWDSRGYMSRYAYDKLHRPTAALVTPAGGTEFITEKNIYGEGVDGDKANNLRGKTYQRCDGSGITTSVTFDFSGNALRSSRQLCSDYKNDIDWSVQPVMDEAVYTTSSTFDALNRATSVTTPDQSVYLPIFNQRGVVQSIDVQLRGATTRTPFVKSVSYDVKGRRENIVYGNGTRCAYQYDPVTFRVAEIRTTGANGTDILQQLRYTYDPSGNVTNIRDNAQSTVFFNNSVVDPTMDYTFDAVYQLISASGREHIGQNLPVDADDSVRMNQPLPGDGSALRNYTQTYQYDAVGNILQLAHSAGAGSWTRTYQYDTASNRLASHTVGGNTETFNYDVHGNIQNQAHLQGLTWNYKDEMSRAGLGGGGTAYYVYGNGQRSRKVIERQDGSREERIYLSSFELYRRWNSAGVLQEQTETLHLMDDTSIVALVETKTIKDGVPVQEQLTRYQYGNHTGSAVLEVDDTGTILSYEEYHPFGSTAYQAINSAIQAAVKRYRYTNMERDEETGLEYHSARYYLPWLGRWLSADPIGLKGGINVYAYCSNNPVNKTDPSGTDEWCGVTDGFFGMFSSECHIAPRVSGGLKMVGGGLEAAAGAAMVGVGAATCEVGVGCPVAALGFFVVAHGSDVTASGVRTIVANEQVDTASSQGLQQLGMSRENANLFDAGISVGGGFGANAITRFPGLTSGLSNTGVAGESVVPSVSIAYKARLIAPSHNYVGVSTAESGTVWSHAIIDNVTKETLGVPTGGNLVVEQIPAAEMAAKLSRWNVLKVTVPVTPYQAAKAAARAASYTEATLQNGTIGSFAWTANNCATYAVDVMKEADLIVPPGFATPTGAFVAAAAQSPAVNIVGTALSAGLTQPPNRSFAPGADPAVQAAAAPAVSAAPAAAAAPVRDLTNPANTNNFTEFLTNNLGRGENIAHIQQRWDQAHPKK